eukprot:3797916-Prymnesium_polylepis.1
MCPGKPGRVLARALQDCPIMPRKIRESQPTGKGRCSSKVTFLPPQHHTAQHPLKADSKCH